MTTTYKVSEHGWLTRCMADVENKTKCVIEFNGADARAIVNVITHTADRIPWTKFPSIPRIKITTPVVIPEGFISSLGIDPIHLVLLMGSIGSIGGAIGSITTVIGIATAHGMKVSFDVVFPDMWDINNDKLLITLE